MNKAMVLMAVVLLSACAGTPKNTDAKDKQTRTEANCPVGSHRTFEGYCQSDTAAPAAQRRSTQRPALGGLPRPQVPSGGLPALEPVLGR